MNLFVFLSLSLAVHVISILNVFYCKICVYDIIYTLIICTRIRPDVFKIVSSLKINKKNYCPFFCLIYFSYRFYCSKKIFCKNYWNIFLLIAYRGRYRKFHPFLGIKKKYKFRESFNNLKVSLQFWWKMCV